MSDLTFLEEITLMLLNEESGYFEPVEEWRMSCVLAGAVLMDLALQDRIDTDLESLTLLDPTPTGDELLDPILKELSDATDESSSVQYWVERMALQTQDLVRQALDRLTDKGILDYEEGGFWVLSRKAKGSSQSEESSAETFYDVRAHIEQLLFSNEIPDPKDIAIVSLMDTCGIFPMMLREEYDYAKERIDLLCRMDLIGQSLAKAVEQGFSAPITSRVIPRRIVPQVKYRDVFFSKAFRSGNFPKFFAELHEKYGSVCSLKNGRKTLYILSGADMNNWVNRKGRLFLRSQEYIQGFMKQWNVSRSVASIDGNEHFRFRKAMRDGVSKTLVEDRIQEVLDIGRQHMRSWEVKQQLGVENISQRMIGEQVSVLMTSTEITGYFENIFDYEMRALLTQVFGLAPKFLMRTPKMNRDLNRVLELYSVIHGTHSPAQRAGKRKDLIDDMIQLHSNDPQFLPETDLGFVFIAPLIAGHYSGSLFSFCIYCLLTNPDLKERITQEADAIFANGDPTHEDLKNLKMDVTERFVMEVLRLYCVIPVHMRHCMNGTNIDGFEIPVGVDCMIAYTASHYLEENFTNPEKFDIDRYLPGRDEHKKTGAYQPFGVGTHTCLGRRFAEFQIVLDVLLICRHLDFEMAPKNYKLKINPVPKLKPTKKFKIKINGIRHPLETESTALSEVARP